MHSVNEKWKSNSAKWLSFKKDIQKKTTCSKKINFVKKILLLFYVFLLFVGPLASSFRSFNPPLALSRYQDPIQGKDTYSH